MRILVVASAGYTDSYGGVQTYLRDTCQGLAARGHEMVLAAQRLRNGLPEREERNGVTIWRYGLGPIPLPLAWPFVFGLWFRRFYERLRDGRPFDIVNVHCSQPDYALCGHREYAETPCLVTFHASGVDEIPVDARRFQYPFWHWKHYCKPLWVRLRTAQKRCTEKHMLGRAARVIVLSQFMRSRAQSLHGVPPGRVQIIPSGVDTGRVHPCSDRRALRRQLGVPEEGPLLFTARRLVARTGVEELVEAMALVAPGHPDVRLLVAGTGCLEARLRQRIAELRLGDQVRLLGYVNDDTLVAHYQAADLFVLPTTALEGFGIATIEALACGLPVLGTSVGATPEILNRVDPALVVREATPRALADALRSLLAAPETLESLRPRCREVAVSEYSWGHIAARLEQTFQEAVSRPAEAGAVPWPSAPARSEDGEQVEAGAPR